MGKKGGGGSIPKVKVPQQVNANSFAQSNLGSYGASLLPSLLSLSNWAQNLATGGNVAGANPLANFGGPNPQKGPLGFDTTLGAALQDNPQQFGAFGGGGGTGVVGGTGASGGSFTGVSTPGGMSSDSIFTPAGTGAPGSSGTPSGAGSGITFNPATDARENAQGLQTFTDASGQSLAWNPAANNGAGAWGNFVNGQWTPTTTAQQGSFAGVTAAQRNAAVAQQQSDSLLGPFLSQAWNDIGQQQQATGMLPGLMNQTGQLTAAATGDYTNMMKKGGSMLDQATTGSGLFPSQQAFVDQATKSQQAAIQQQFASEGLTSSTQNVQMKGEAAQQGAATAGELIQGNISAAQNQQQIAQASQKIALGGQELSLGEQAALTQELASISQQSSALQGGVWNETMQGYQMVNSLMETAAGAFNYSNAGFAQYTQASAQNAANAIGLQQAAAQSSQQGMSSLMGGLGQILGGSGGSGGGLLGGLGSLFGGIGGTVGAAGGVAAGIGGLAAAGGTAATAGGGVAAIATAAGASFVSGPDYKISATNLRRRSRRKLDPAITD